VIAHHLSEDFDSRLWGARAKTRDAVELVLTQNSVEAAVAMVAKAAVHHIEHPPLVGYDEAAVDHTRAQTCAWRPTRPYPEVQTSGRD
jgi:hypothetical protein